MIDQDYIKTKEEGKEYLQKKEYNKAIDSYIKCLSFKDINENELSILNLNIDDAFQFISKSISYNPSYQKAHYRKIQCLLQMEKFQESFNLCKDMIKQYPNVSDFSILIKQIQEKIEQEQNQTIKFKDYSAILTSETIQDKQVKDTLQQIQIKIEQKNHHKKIFLRGEFLEEFMNNASNTCKNNQLTSQFILNNIYKVTEEDKSFQLPENSINSIIQVFIENSKNFNTEQGKKNTLEWLRILQFSNILFCGEVLFENIQKSKYQDDILQSSISILSSLCFNNINYYLQQHSYDTEIIIKLSEYIQNIIEWTAVQLKKNKKGDLSYRQFLQLLFKLQFKLNQKYLDKMYFYRKDKLSKTDMVLIQELLISSYDQSVKKIIDSDIQRCLFASYLRKPMDLFIIDSILSIYSILLKEQTFIDKVINDVAFQDFNIQLQRFLVASNHEITYIIKYGLLLFKTNKQKQLPELVSFLRIFQFSDVFEKILQITKEVEFTEAMEFIGFMSCFDQFKVELVENKKNLLYKLSLKVNFENYEQGLNWLITVSNLCFDQLKDYELKQKDKYGLTDEKLEDLKKFEEKYRQADIEQAKSIFRYNEEYIKEKKISKILLEDVEVIKNLSQFILKSPKNNSELVMTYVAQLLSKLVVLSLSANNQIDKNLFDKHLILFSVKSINSIKTTDTSPLIIQFSTYVSKILKDCNPNIFQYSEVHIIIDALFKALRVSQHELLTFEVLLSLVQLTSLGEQTTSKLVNADILSLLQNLLMEDQNYYIIHGTLEVLNNICLNEKMMQRIGTMTTLIQLIFAHFESCYELLLKQKPEEITKSYDQPIKIINTIYNLLAINASNTAFKDKANDHICAKPETLVILLQKYAKNDGYMRMEFLYKFVFMTQSFRNGKKYSGQEKVMIQQIYDEIKEQYKKERGGSIPKNDTRFEYMDSILI